MNRRKLWRTSTEVKGLPNWGKDVVQKSFIGIDNHSLDAFDIGTVALILLVFRKSVCAMS